METIGLFLRNFREDNNISLQEVSTMSNIDLTTLSRIENEKRLPTRDQLITLSKIYNCDENDMIKFWLSDKIISEVQNEKFGIDALLVAEERLIHGKPIKTLPNLDLNNKLKIESRRYIGSKAKLTEWIITSIKKELNVSNSFIDVFAGTASVSKSVMKSVDKLILNDILYSNEVIYKAFFEKGKWDIEKLTTFSNKYSNLDDEKIKENYFSLNFGDKFFEKSLSKKIGFIRQDIEDKKTKLTIKEYNILLGSLIYNIDRLANTVGHYDAYIKKEIKKRELTFKLIEPYDDVNVEIYRSDANQLARKIKGDIAYIDPPYNSRQYSRFYHLYETLVKWDNPDLFGVALKPAPENMSEYCTVSAKKAFKDLIDNLDVKYLVVSYNNTYNSKSKSSENNIKLEEIEEILKNKGKTRILEKAHAFFNTGKTDFQNHKEYLFITTVN